MSYDVIAARYVGEYKIEITFENGGGGIVDFRPYIRKGGVFAKLEDLEYFKQFSVHPELGVLTWGNEVDVAPETLYAEATGEPLPEWMQTGKAIGSIAKPLLGTDARAYAAQVRESGLGSYLQSSMYSSSFQSRFGHLTTKIFAK